MLLKSFGRQVPRAIFCLSCEHCHNDGLNHQIMGNYISVCLHTQPLHIFSPEVLSSNCGHIESSAEAERQVTFLKDCLEAFVTPSAIRHRVRKTNPKRPWTIERAFLRDDINKELDYLEQTNDDFHRTLTNVLKQLSTFDQFRFCKLLTETATRLKKVTESKRKYLKRFAGRSWDKGSLTIVRSSTSRTLPWPMSKRMCSVENSTLEFHPTWKAELRESVESEFELCWEHLASLEPKSQQKKHDCKAAIADICQQYVNQRPDTRGYLLNKQHFETIRDLKKNKDLVITRPDKGNGVVLMSRTDYVKKMKAILSDKTKFVEIGDAKDHDKTLQHECSLQAFLLRAKNSGDLSKAVYEQIRPVGATHPRMYGVPKIHKEDNPLRPILSMVNAPHHAMAKWLTELLKPVVSKFGNHTIKDTFEFCNILDEYCTTGDFSPENSFMCSYDVVSLFTNIPLQETIIICLDALHVQGWFC